MHVTSHSCVPINSLINTSIMSIEIDLFDPTYLLYPAVSEQQVHWQACVDYGDSRMRPILREIMSATPERTQFLSQVLFKELRSFCKHDHMIKFSLFI